MSKLFKTPNATVERYRNSRGQDVPIDTFLYACLEAEQTMKALAAKQGQSIQWPTLTDLSSADLESELAAQQLQDIFEDLLSWYSANYPDLSTNLAWDYGVVSLIVQPLVSMASDLNTVHTKKFGETLPEYDDTAEENSPVWSMIRSLIERFFTSKSSYINRYMEWSFGKDKSITPEPGSRPPVGRNSPFNQQRRGGGGGGQGGNRGGNDRNRGGGNRPPRRDDRGGDRPPRGEARGNNHHDHGGGGGGNRDRGPRNNRNDRGDRGPRGPRNPPEANAELEAAAIQECKEAFSFLEQNPGEDKVVLKPQNSFYRRIQHQVVVSNGFDSESTGDDKDRAVVVWRKR